jgi:hypothetical protein
VKKDIFIKGLIGFSLFSTISFADTLQDLDLLLSPFEDMTEYALNNDKANMQKGYAQILKLETNKKIMNSITPDAVKKLKKNIKKLGRYIDKGEYINTALTSNEIFYDNATNFKNKSSIADQIHIEHLDYMGFRLLALAQMQDIDYIQMKSAVTQAQTEWIAIKDKIDDKNSVDAFNLLFSALQLSIKHKDSKMIQILASMDLALVDVIEKNSNKRAL